MPDRGRGVAKLRAQRATKAETLPQPTLLQGRQADQERPRQMGELMKEEAVSQEAQPPRRKEP